MTTGVAMYDRALELIDEGVLVAIIPAATPDGKRVGLFALSQDLDLAPVVKAGALSSSLGARAGVAAGLTFRTARQARLKGLVVHSGA